MPKCGRCNKEITQDIYLVEAGYGPVHVFCGIYKVNERKGASDK